MSAFVTTRIGTDGVQERMLTTLRHVHGAMTASMHVTRRFAQRSWTFSVESVPNVALRTSGRCRWTTGMARSSHTVMHTAQGWGSTGHSSAVRRRGTRCSCSAQTATGSSGTSATSARPRNTRRRCALVDIPPEVRRRVLDRDNDSCVVCGTGGSNRLQLHHVQYRSQGGKHLEGNLATLCQRCHRRIHAEEIEIELLETQTGEWCWFTRHKHKR